MVFKILETVVRFYNTVSRIHESQPGVRKEGSDKLVGQPEPCYL